MRLIALGDIHGCATALHTLLTAIDLRPSDKVVSLGDYVNKGPDTKAVLDTLIELSNWGILVPILGNHELKLLTAKRLGKLQLNREILVDPHTLRSYGKAWRSEALDSIPESHWQFLQNHCLRWFATPKYIFVHSGLQPQQSLFDQTDQRLFWDKLRHAQPHQSGKIMVCGHTPQRSGYPLNLGHSICLDTAACEGQWLSALDVLTGDIWQANQRGQLRQLHLSDVPSPLGEAKAIEQARSLALAGV